jgi:hypothetical protein
MPPPERADICDKLERTLNLPTGRFAGLADLQRRQELNKTESPRSASFPTKVGAMGQISQTYRDRDVYCSGNCRVSITSLWVMNPMHISPSWFNVDTKWYLGVRCRKCGSPILFALDHSDGEVQPVPAGKLLLTCPLAKCRHQADYSTATVSRFKKEPSA